MITPRLLATSEVKALCAKVFSCLPFFPPDLLRRLPLPRFCFSPSIALQYTKERERDIYLLIYIHQMEKAEEAEEER